MNPTESLAAFLALGSALAWGAGDFVGGLAARRVPVLRVVALSNLLGALLLLAIAFALREPMLSVRTASLAIASGIGVSVGLASLYHALSIGRMGAVAPVAAVVTAIIPVIAGTMSQGMPGPVALVGFALALVGVTLVSGPERARWKPVFFALLAGVGLGSFLVLIHGAAAASPFGALALSRATALVALGLVLLFRREAPTVPRAALPLVLLAMAGDVGGNVLFVAASALGRLDVAGVLSSLYPATTVALALFILRERLSRVQAIGVALLLVAIVAVVLG